MLVRIARWCYRVSALSCSRTASVSISTEPPSSSSSYNRLQQYSPPSWTKDLAYKPSAYVQLAVHHTPIHPWKLPGLPKSFQLSVKRDDMTGSTLSGNKVRKLEFLLGDALQMGCKDIITCGGIQSNHARATAVASRQLGLQPHLILEWHGKIDAVDCRGNLLLDRAVGAKIILAPYDTGPAYRKKLWQKMEEYKTKLESEGLVPYVIPMGGSNTVGTWGDIEAFRELMDQGLHENFDDIVVATGSGGTISGLAIANYLTGSKLRIHGVCICDDAEYFHGHVDEQLQALGLTVDSHGKPIASRDIVDVIEGYKGLGYAQNTDEELALLVEIMNETGLSLDRVYTLKGVRGMLLEMQNNPTRFLGRRVLYIHTGGVFGLYDGEIDRLLKESPSSNRVHSYLDIIPD